MVVIAGVACLEPGLEPAPQSPVSTGTVQPIDLEQTFGPVIASGTDAGRSWSLRGRIDAHGAATFVQTSTGGGGGSRGGALPFQYLGWKKLGHFGSVGSGELHGTRDPSTLTLITLKGVVSKQTATIDVRLADGTSLPAQIIDTGDPRASFFVAVWSAPVRWEVMIARDAAGAELETYRQPPTQAIPTQASATSTP